MQSRRLKRLIRSCKTRRCSHRQLLLFVVFCVTGTCIFQVLVTQTSINPSASWGLWGSPSTTPTIKIQNLNFDLNGSMEAWCTDAPKLEPFHKSIMHFVKIPSQPECITPELPLLFNATLNGTVVPVKSLEDFRNLSILSCCYKVITREWPDDVNVRKERPDDRHSFSKTCFPLSLESETTIPPDHEFIAIYCQLNLTKKLQHSNGMDLKDSLSAIWSIFSRPKTTTTAIPKVLVGAPNITNGERIVDMFAFVHMKPEVKARKDELEKWQSFSFEEKMNVLILGIDSTSHMHFIRAFGKTHEFLVNNMSALEMNWFNKVGANTYPCLIPMLTGKSEKEITSFCGRSTEYDTCPIIWKNFSKRGYATLHVEDCPEMSIFNYYKIGFNNSAPTDYYSRTLAVPAQIHLGRNFRVTRYQCQGPRLTVQSLLHYTIQFVNKMESHRKNYFGFMFSTGITHGDVNLGFWADHYFLDTLKWLKDRISNNTVLIVMSDHGQRFGLIRNYRQGQLENNLPALYLVFPQTLRVKYGRAFQNIWGNQNRLVTTFDLHETLVDILEARDKLGDVIIKRREERLKREVVLPRGISLFLPVPPERSCAQAGIPPDFCACNKMVPVQVTRDSVQLAASFTVDHINRLIRAHQSCKPLRLHVVVSALKMVGSGMEGWEGYLINFITLPGYASFQALVTRSHLNDSWQVSGAIERTNMYGDQSSCVRDVTLKNFCYCDQSRFNFK